MIELRQSIRLILAAVLAFIFSDYLQWQESYWILISALLALHISSNPLARQQKFFLLLTALLSAATATVSSLITPWVVLLAIYLFITTYSSVSFGMMQPAFWGAAFIANFYANLSSGFAADWHGAVHRFITILLGFVIAILLRLVFFPNRIENDCRLVLAECMQQLLGLSQSIFDCYLAADYSDKQFHYETLLHEKRRDFAYAMSIARQLVIKIKPASRKPIIDVLCDIEQLYEMMLSMGLLNYRIEDRSTLEIAYQEFSEMAENIDAGIRALKLQLFKKKIPESISERLKENIYQFEDVSRSTLDVAAKDPMIFLLFVQDLYALNTLMEQLSSDIVIWSGETK